jgi:hypothetical protein
VIEGSMLDEGKNNYLCTLFIGDGAGEAGLCFADARAAAPGGAENIALL